MTNDEILNPNILEDFCNSFNSKLRNYKLSYYIRNKHDNISGENAVHSAIIWSRYIVRLINDSDIIHNRTDIPDLFLFISYIDILLESTDQVYRVLYKTKESFQDINEPNCFKDRPMIYRNLDNRKYFKEIRAMFGSHPINLKGPDKKDVKRFADFPFCCSAQVEGLGFKGDYIIRTWTNTKNDENTIRLSLYIQDLIDYAKIIYSRYRQFEKRLRDIAAKRV